MKDTENIGTGVLVFKNKKVLLGKRIGKSYRAGMFGVPGGRVQTGESIVESAKRELLEETGLKAKDIEYVGLVNDNQRKHTFIHLVFVCKKYAGKPETKEVDKCEEWKWFDIDDLPENILPGHLAGIQMYLEDKKLIELL